MREFSKSILSFSWAMSLFGVQQTTNLLSPGRAAKAFDSVTEATREQLTDILKSTFRVGDNLQRGALDLTFGMFTGEAFNPNNWTRMVSDVARQSADAMTRGVQGVATTAQQVTATATQAAGSSSSAANSSTTQRQGWGSMPS